MHTGYYGAQRRLSSELKSVEGGGGGGGGLEEQFPPRTITSSTAKNHLVIEQHVIIRTSYINEF